MLRPLSHCVIGQRWPIGSGHDMELIPIVRPPQLNPIKTEGSERQVVVSSTSIEDLLSNILKELKIINLHLSFVTDTNITNLEVG